MPWAPVGGMRGLKSDVLDATAKATNASVYQVAIAWLLQRSPVMLPIPGTSSVKHLEENVAAGKLRLTDAQMKALGG
jgi:aryl-alcohol dehydrogenase-like predicted oxidoreductase